MPSERESGSETADQLIAAMVSLAQQFSSRPGFMWTHGGFAVLHADWPAYPNGEGVGATIAAMAEAGSKFYPISNIDQCTLFLVDRLAKSGENKFNQDFIHVALWDRDIRECARRGYVDGLTHLDEDSLYYSGDSILLTDEGQHVALIHELAFGLHPLILDRVQLYLYNVRYEAAIREASILLESSLRSLTGTTDTASGFALIDKCFGPKDNILPKDMVNSERLRLRHEFRLYFKYVRNPFAHEDRKIDLVTCSMILRRCTYLMRTVEILKVAQGSRVPAPPLRSNSP